MSDEEKCYLMSALWQLTVCCQYDGPGTVRTGREWFDRYMIFPWERRGDFVLVSVSNPDGAHRG